MSVGRLLENSARAFNEKYACDFNFTTFDENVEEYTFLRPNNGWKDVYKLTFDQMYKMALEKAVLGAVNNLNGEEMLDDFEYTLIRPYVNERNSEIKHKPYVGMDKIARLEYLDALTRHAPSSPVELYSEKYKNGELTLRQMKARQGEKDTENHRYVEIAGYVQALERVSKGRTAIWKALHPFRCNAEKKHAAHMKSVFIGEVSGGEETYERFARAACEIYDGHRRASANLAASISRAKEEINRLQKLNDAMKESLLVTPS